MAGLFLLERLMLHPGPPHAARLLLAASVPVITDTAGEACASRYLRSLKKFTDKIFNTFSPLVTY